MKTKIIIIVVLILAAAALWRFAPYFQKLSKTVPATLENFSASSTAEQVQTTIQDIKQQVFAPPPLKTNRQSENPSLTRAGVIAQTNIQRSQNGALSALKENSQLDKAAQLKLADMFAQQYFEHINPQGKGPSDLAAAAGYAYISIGENLALGNFKDDQELVQDWMNSPGHRANILNAKFTEIGVAVGQGVYQGQKTWLAVQEFGRPASACPAVDSNIKAQIAPLQAEADALQTQLVVLKNQIDAMRPQTQSEYDQYNQMVADYNSQVRIYNNKVDTLKYLTGQYNAQVNAYNACLGAN